MPRATEDESETAQNGRGGGSLRSHRGNKPVLEQSIHCPLCEAVFTRQSHLSRHLKTHSNDRTHVCETCGADFTRGDLLTRHARKVCSKERPFRRACLPCSRAKIKCNREDPCDKCLGKNKPCTYRTNGQKLDIPGGRSSNTSESPERSPQDQGIHLTHDGTSDGVSGVSSGILGLPGPSSQSSNNHHLGQQLMQDFRGSARTDWYHLMNNPLVNPLEVLSGQAAKLPYMNQEPNMPQGQLSTVSHPHNPTNSQLLYPFGIMRNPDFNIRSMFELMTPPMLAPENAAVHSLLNDPTMGLPDFSDTSTSEKVIPGRTHSQGDLDNYLELFFRFYGSQSSIIHVPTFVPEQRSSLLLNAMRACGALYLQTRQAKLFVNETLAHARSTLLPDLMLLNSFSDETLDLLSATVLIQTMGLFHEDPVERQNSHLFHTMLLNYIRKTGLLAIASQYQPPENINADNVESVWLEWCTMEARKRALLLHFVHDCCHGTIFVQDHGYKREELDFPLQCERELWYAGSAREWFDELRRPSSYGSPTERLRGFSFQSLLRTVCSPRGMEVTPILPPAGLFVLIKYLVRELFDSLFRSFKECRSPETTLEYDEGALAGHNNLKNWIACWSASPDVHYFEQSGKELPFYENGLPFYWLGQLAIFAYSKRQAPFHAGFTTNPINRYQLLRNLQGNVREFLGSGAAPKSISWEQLESIHNESADKVVYAHPPAATNQTSSGGGIVDMFNQ